MTMIINIENIYDVSFDNGIFHFSSNSIKYIPEIISYSKSRDRHFIFYKCIYKLKVENTFPMVNLNKRSFYRYEIFYEKKFTDKSEDLVKNKLLSYLRDEKINTLL